MAVKRTSVVVLWFGLPVALALAALGFYFARGGELIDTRADDLRTLLIPPCLEAFDCAEPSPELLAGFPGDETCERQEVGTKRLCLILVGSVDPELVQYLVDYYESQYGLRLHVARPISLDDLDIPYERSQYEAAALHDAVERFNPLPFMNRANRVIIVTAVDLYRRERPQVGWTFGRQFFGENPPDDALYVSAVFSAYRLDPRSNGFFHVRRVFLERARKMLDRYVAFLYFDLSPSPDPRDVTYEFLNDARDLDAANNQVPWSHLLRPTPHSLTTN